MACQRGTGRTLRLHVESLPRTGISAQRNDMYEYEAVPSMLDAARERSRRPAATRDDHGRFLQGSCARAHPRSREHSLESHDRSMCVPFNCVRVVRVRYYHAFPSTSA